MKSKAKISEKYIHELYSTNSLKEWVSEIFFKRFKIPVKVILNHNQVVVNFKQNSLEHKIEFLSNGKDEIISLSREVLFYDISKLKDFEFNKLLKFKNLVLLGKKSIDWFYKRGFNHDRINYDFIIMLLFVLNRIEEYESISFEKHSRFQLTNSILSEKSLYLRPFIDEWFIFLGELLKIRGFRLVANTFEVSVSHDVDNVSRYAAVPLLRLIPTIIIDIIKRPKDLYSFIKNKKYFVFNEHHNSFDWIMHVSKKYKIKNKFYFLVHNTSLRYDYRYDINAQLIQSLIKKLFYNGHEIGIHYSYNASVKNTINKEWKKLKTICKKYNIEILGGRMHYLRIKFLESLRQMELSNQRYDNTITFFETGGFRCGTCFSYFPYDIFEKRKIKVEVRPLILMEGSVFGYSSINNYNEAFKYIKNFVDNCYDVRGTFSLLWHNSDLECEWKKKLYIDVLDYCMSMKSKSSF